MGLPIKSRMRERNKFHFSSTHVWIPQLEQGPIEPDSPVWAGGDPGPCWPEYNHPPWCQCPSPQPSQRHGDL